MCLENWVLISVKGREAEKYTVMCPLGPKTKNDSDGEGQQQFTWPTTLPDKERHYYHANHIENSKWHEECPLDGCPPTL
jgi:hypothetical protein